MATQTPTKQQIETLGDAVEDVVESTGLAPKWQKAIVAIISAIVSIATVLLVVPEPAPIVVNVPAPVVTAQPTVADYNFDKAGPNPAETKPKTADVESKTDPSIVTDGLGAGPVVTNLKPVQKNRYTPEQSLAVAALEAKTSFSGRDWSGRCEGFASGFALGWASSGFYSARTHAEKAIQVGIAHQVTDPNLIPAGAIALYKWGKYGHAVLSDGNGWVYSTDILRQGKVDRVPLSVIKDHWGMDYAGWIWTVPDNLGYASGTNGVAPPVVVTAKPLAWPLYPGKDYKRITTLKKKIGWSNTSPHFGKKLEKWIRNWEDRTAGFPVNGKISEKQYYALVF